MTATLLLNDDEAGIARAAALLARGGLVAFPTETVYGLGADATDGRAVAGIYAAKGRPRFNPLIAHVADLDAARRIACFDDDAERLAAAFWPGPLTLVLPLSPGAPVCDLATAGLSTIAVRIPGHPLARELIGRVGRPVVAPSANRSGRVSPTEASHVVGDLDGRISAVIDGGPARIGLESTIVALTGDGPRLLRPGGIARAALAGRLGRPLPDAAPAEGERPLAPGMLSSHYAPNAAVRLDAAAPRANEGWLGFGASMPAGVDAAFNLSPTGDLAEAASRLFLGLRTLDASGVTVIAVAPIPADGLGEAIRDRLARAAAPRPHPLA